MSRPRAPLSVSGATLWFAASYGIALVGYLALNGLGSRLVGPDSYGIFVIILTTTMMAGQLSLAGIHRTGMRDAARLRENASPAELAIQLRDVHAVTRLLVPAVGVVTAVAAGLVAARHVDNWTVISLSVGVLVVLSAHQKLWASYLRGFGYLRLAGFLEGRSGGAIVAVLQATLLLAFLVAAPDLQLIGALAAMAVGFLIPSVLGRHIVSRHWEGIYVPWRPLTDLRLALARGGRFAILQAATHVSLHLEIWLAAILLSQVEASQFTAAQRLALLLIVPLTLLQVVLAPTISRLHARGETAHLERLLRAGATVSLLVAGLMWLPFLVLPSGLLGLVFGSGFAKAGIVLTVLSLAYIVEVASGISNVTLSMAHLEGVASSVRWGSVVTRIGLGVPAALTLGPIGLAIASVLTSITTFGVLWWMVLKRLGLRTHPTTRPSLREFARAKG